MHSEKQLVLHLLQYFIFVKHKNGLRLQHCRKAICGVHKFVWISKCLILE